MVYFVTNAKSIIECLLANSITLIILYIHVVSIMGR